jgi:hypothetical protein
MKSSFFSLFNKINEKSQSTFSKSLISNYQEFKNSLKEETRIRFYMEIAPGTGHQSSTLLLMQLIIDVWIENDSENANKKTVELIYRNNDNKHILLRNLPKLAENNPKIKGVNIILIEKIIEENEKIPLRFGFTCGYDRNDNTAKDAKVKYFLKLQPLFWDDMDAIHYQESNKQTFLNNYDHKHSTSENENLAGLPADFRSLVYLSELPKEPEWSLQQDDVVKAIKEILDNSSQNNTYHQKQIELCVAYKIGKSSMFTNKTSGILFNLVTSLTVARLQNSINNDVIILNFTDDMEDDEMHKAKYFFDNFALTSNGLNKEESNKLEKIEKETVEKLIKISKLLNEITESKTKVNFTYNVLCSYDKIAAFMEQDAFNIILINVTTRIPSNIFNYVLTRGTLPSIFEGSGTASIAVPIGNPYLKINYCPDSSTHYLYVKNHKILSEEKAKYCQLVANRLLDTFSGWTNGKNKETPAKAIAEFIKQCNNGFLKSYFSETKTFYSNKENNKLTLALGLFNMFIKNQKIR